MLAPLRIGRAVLHGSNAGGGRAQRAIARAASVLLFTLLPAACSLAFPVHARPEGSGGSDRDRDEPTDASADASAGASDYRSAVVLDAPVAYLRFGEKGGAVAKDEMTSFPGAYPSGGVTYGVPGAIAGDDDTAVSFDGTTGVTMPPGLDFAGDAPFTLELWAKQTAYLGDGLTLDHQQYSPVRDGWLLRLGDGEFGVERWRDGASNGSIQLSTARRSLGVYHHVVATFDGMHIRLYLDGVALPTDPGQGTSPLKASHKTWIIGKQAGFSGNAFIGSLDEVAIYDRALTADQISRHYLIGAGLAHSDR